LKAQSSFFDSEYRKAPLSTPINNASINAQDTLDILEILEIHQSSSNSGERERTWAEDGRWLQAFGRLFHGRDSIVSFEKVLHANPGWAASHVSVRRDPEIRVLRPDVVVIHQYSEREGQIINDVITPTRKINTTYIITKEDGIWLLRDKVTMDERERSTQTQ